MQGQGIAGLGVALDRAVGCDKGALKRGADVSVQLGVFRGLFLPPEHLGHLRHDLRRMGEKGRGEHLVGHRADAPRIVLQHERIAVEPVVVVVAAVLLPQQVRVVAGG